MLKLTFCNWCCLKHFPGFTFSVNQEMKKFNLVENIVFWFVLTLPTVWMCVTIQENCLSDSTMMSPQFLVKISSRNTTDLEETLFQWFEMCFECRTKLSQVFKNVTICESPGRYSHFSITSIYEHWGYTIHSVTILNHSNREIIFPHLGWWSISWERIF